MDISELHYLTLQLLRIVKRCETRVLGVESALAYLLAAHQAGGPLPSLSEIEQAIDNGEMAAKKARDPEYEQLEASLLAGQDF